MNSSRFSILFNVMTPPTTVSYDVDPHWSYVDPDPQKLWMRIQIQNRIQIKSGSRTIKSPNWFQTINQVKKKNVFKFVPKPLEISSSFRFRLEKTK